MSNVFELAIDREEMDSNPAFKKPKTGYKHTPKSNPTIPWEEVPELLTLMEENPVDASILTQLATKFYFLSGLRVSACVSLKWEWYDSKDNVWRLPPETRGLKRKKDEGQTHLIPVSSGMKTLMNQLLESILGTTWVWFVIKEVPPLNTIIGGILLLGSVTIFIYQTTRKSN